MKHEVADKLPILHGVVSGASGILAIDRAISVDTPPPHVGQRMSFHK